MVDAVLARCIFGPKTHDVHEGTRERTEHRYYGEPVESFAFSEERCNTHGCINIVTPEDQLDPIERYEDITTASFFEVDELPESFVERLGMSDVRVLTIHINSDAFRHSILRVRTTLRAIFAKALIVMSYTDFITGDFNLFANRQFKTDRGGAYIGGIVVEVLEEKVAAMNPWMYIWIGRPKLHLIFHLRLLHKMSLIPSRKVRKQQIWTVCCAISVFYNRQKYETERPTRISDDLHLAPDYLHSVSERPRQLLGYDVCLRPSDNNWHIPLIVRTSAYSTRNKRTRGQAAQDLRHQRYREYQDRSYQYQQQSRYHGYWQDHGAHPYSRLQDKTGMAGMADGDNRHYGCQDNFAGKIHRYNGWHECSILLILLYTDTTVIEITLTLSRIVALPIIRYYLWSLTVHGALWMLELNIRPNSFSFMNSFVRF